MDRTRDSDGATGGPEGSGVETDGRGASAGSGPGGGQAGVPRKPRIEVLRSRPSAGSEAAAAPPLRGPGVAARAGDEHGATQDRPLAAAPNPARPVQAPADRKRGLSGSRFMLLSLLGLLVIAAALLYTYFGQGSGNDAAAREAVRSENAEFAEEPLIDGQAAPPAPVPEPGLSTEPEPEPEPERGVEAPAVQPAPAEPAAAAPTRGSAPAITPEQPPTAQRPSGGEASAVNTARAFYSALSNGDGASAAQLVVPAKRQSGPLSAAALSRYYSSFRRPLQVRRFTAVDENTVRVAYDYVLADGRLCRGEAAVDVVASGDSRLVRGIRTRGPC